MSNDCRIELPLHVRSKQVLEVIGKLLGMPFEVKTDKKPPRGWMSSNSSENCSFDSTLPCSPENDWYLFFNDSLKQESYINIINIISMKFEDLAGSGYDWNFHVETVDENCKLLTPNSYLVAGAVGKKLVDFFGGTVIYSEDKELEYKNNTPLFPPKLSTQTSNDRYYQFYNSLYSIKMITANDLLEAENKVYIRTERDNKLIEYLKVYETYKKIDDSVSDEKEQKAGRKNKI